MGERLTKEEAVLSRYGLAFESANPGKPAPRIWYRGHGWYGVEGRRGALRLSHFEEWSERLENNVRSRKDRQP